MEKAFVQDEVHSHNQQLCGSEKLYLTDNGNWTVPNERSVQHNEFVVLWGSLRI